MTRSSSSGAPDVIFVNRYFHPDHSATSQLVTDLADHLTQRGWKVAVVTGRQLYVDAAAKLPASERWKGIDIHRVWTTRFGRTNLLGRLLDYLTFYLSATFKLLRLSSRGTLLVAKTDPPLLGVPVAAVASLRGARLVQWLQDVFPEVASELRVIRVPGAVPLLKFLRDGSLRRAARNVVLSESMARRLSSTGAPLTVCANWVTHSLQSSRISEETVRHDLGADSTKIVVGYSGNLGRAHDFATIVAAAERVREDERFRFVITGAGAGQQALRTLVKARNLTSFIFKPYVPAAAVASSLAAIDIHWLSLDPRLEGLIVPSKFYGILAAGRPVIYVGDAEAELAKLIREFKCGFAVAPGDGDDFAAHLANLADDVEMRQAMGRSSLQLYEERFDRSRALECWHRTLTEVVDSPSERE